MQNTSASGHEATAPAGYARLQECLDRLIGKIGLERAIGLVDGFLGQGATPLTREKSRVRLVTEFLVCEATRLFGLEDQHFYSSHIREYREARMCCFYLLRKYTDESYPMIGLSFRCSERKVTYGQHKCEERLAFPQGFPDFTRACNQLETLLVDFLSRLN